MRVLTALVRQRHQAARCYAAATELAVQQESPFLKFANPEPQTFNHLQALGQIPETKASTQTEASRQGCVDCAHTGEPSALVQYQDSAGVSDVRTFRKCSRCTSNSGVV